MNSKINILKNSISSNRWCLRKECHPVFDQIIQNEFTLQLTCQCLNLTLIGNIQRGEVFFSPRVGRLSVF